MRRLVLSELQTEFRIELSAAERDAIGVTLPSMAVVPVADIPETFNLTPGSMIGSVQMNGLSLTILPKIPVDRMLFLLSYSIYRRNWKSAPFHAGEDEDIVEAIIAGFLEQVDRIVRRGLLRGYRVEEDDLTTIRGRIRFDDQIRDFYGRFPPVCVVYDEFTEDIVENRLLKAALSRLGRFTYRSDRLRQRVLEALSVMPNVQRVAYTSTRLPTVLYTRLNEHYRPAVETAKLILRSMSHDIQAGSLSAEAFLFDMSKVFEDFVTLALRDTLRLSDVTFPQGARGRNLVLDQSGVLKLEPDLSWWVGDACLFVGDVKYKRTRHDDALHSDLYQLLAYTVAANVPNGLLIYAAGEAPTRPHRVRHLHKSLEVTAVNLRGKPYQILEEIEVIGRSVRDLRAKSEAARTMDTLVK